MTPLRNLPPPYPLPIAVFLASQLLHDSFRPSIQNILRFPRLPHLLLQLPRPGRQIHQERLMAPSPAVFRLMPREQEIAANVVYVVIVKQCPMMQKKPVFPLLGISRAFPPANGQIARAGGGDSRKQLLQSPAKLAQDESIRTGYLPELDRALIRQHQAEKQTPFPQ